MHFSTQDAFPKSTTTEGASLGRADGPRPAPASARAVAEAVMSHVRSQDGTAIAFEHQGAGPAVILVDGALCSRAFGPSAKIAPLLARHFTVYTYDRRGRAQSGNTAPYAPARELDDLAALIDHAGGSADLLGLSSGAALALHAAADGAGVRKVVAYEPPYVDDEGQRGGTEHERRLKSILAAGDRNGALKYFMKDMVGVPGAMVTVARFLPWIWPKLVRVAHTLPYDAAILTGFRIPKSRFASIVTPVLVMNGSKSDARLRDAARRVAAVIPQARHQELAGQTHAVKASALVPPVVEFLTSQSPAPIRS
jgi:pimeloyl-ACP methyl ester carboxylesterase